MLGKKPLSSPITLNGVMIPAGASKVSLNLKGRGECGGVEGNGDDKEDKRDDKEDEQSG